uniref:Plac8 onzin related protein 1 n=1 Tax=Oryzias latipes TaxID=8090 RepID=A0A3P9HF85_ORYLA
VSAISVCRTMSHKSSEWNSGLLSCCDDMSSCCYGFWCCPCLACTVAGSFGENRCLPLCDICSPAALSVGIRHMYGIKGSLCRDIATSCICVWCNWCQMHRELKIRNRDTSVVIKQPTPAVSK